MQTSRRARADPPPERDTPLLTRELVYTGLTRARDSVCIWAPNADVLLDACTRTVMRSGGLNAD